MLTYICDNCSKRQVVETPKNGFRRIVPYPFFTVQMDGFPHDFCCHACHQKYQLKIPTISQQQREEYQ